MEIFQIDINNFHEIDKFVIEVRENFRKSLIPQQDLFSSCFNLFINLIKSISRLKSPQEWENTKGEDYLRVTSSAIELLICIYYQCESGFFESAKIIYRNIYELSLVAIAIGFDNNLYSKWKGKHRLFSNTEKIKASIFESKVISDNYKELSQFLFNEWKNCSQDYLHPRTRNHVENRIIGPRIHLGISKLSSEIIEEVSTNLSSSFFNLISLTIDVFNYDSKSKDESISLPLSNEILIEYHRINSIILFNRNMKS